MSSRAWPAARSAPVLAAGVATLLTVALGSLVASASDAASAGADAGASAGPVPGRAFFEQHCYRCHGPEKQKGDLRLDTLPWEAGSAERWTRVLEVLEAGEMPPPKRPRPDPAEVERAAGEISGWLVSVAGPPVPALRRLSRVEYEHTVQDLLGIDTALADRLPEDGSVQGFDRVAGGLGLSSVLLGRYLEAADAAFEGVVRRIRPLPPATRRAVLMEARENIDSVEKKKAGTIAVEGALVKFTPGWPLARIDAAHPIEDGVYRCRVAVWPHQPGDRTLALAVYAGPLFGPAKRPFVGVYDVTGTPEEPRVIEFTARLKDGHTLHLVPWVFPEHITWRDGEREARPGVAIAWAETYGPLDQDFPSAAQVRLFGAPASIRMEEREPIWMRHRKGVRRHEVVSDTPREDVERIIRAFVPRAFRRPVEEPEVAPFVQLALGRLEAGRSFEDAVRAGVTAVLCAPQFLLLNRGAEVDGYTLASRLSYFLWSTLPDEELMRVAGAGGLDDPELVRAQVDRLIDDPRIARFVDGFTGQWLDLREIEFTTPDKKLYPEFDPLLQESMLRETRGFFRHVLAEDRSVFDFVDSDDTFLNERLARHYGIDGVQGHENSRLVALPEEGLRGGVLTHASVLKVTANGTTTSPILRGVWVLENVLGRPSPPPPEGVPAVEPDIRGATSIRDQLERHRSDPSCARCHTRIDPPGFALECFDPIGGLRDRYRSLGQGDRPPGPKVAYKLGPAVEGGAETTGGRAFEDFAGFRRHLLEEERGAVARCIAGKLMVYAAGRPLRPADRPALEAVVAEAEVEGLGLRALVHAVVASDFFRAP